MIFGDRFYSVGELARVTGYHRDSIYRAIAAGALAAAKPGGRWLIAGAAINAWLQTGRSATPAPPDEGLNVLEVASQLGHKPSACVDVYGRLFEEFDPARRRLAVEVIREARRAVRDGTVPTGYPGARPAGKRGRRATSEEGD